MGLVTRISSNPPGISNKGKYADSIKTNPL